MKKIDEYSKITHFQTFLFDDTKEGFKEMAEHRNKMEADGYWRVNTSLVDGKRRVHYSKTEDV